MMMNHEPVILLMEVKVCGQYVSDLGFSINHLGDSFHAVDPSDIPMDDNLQICYSKFDLSGVVEDRNPAVTNGRPPGTDLPARMDTMNRLVGSPDGLHLSNV